MKVTFRSDTEADFACLEGHLQSGAFGAMPEKWMHEAQHDLTTLQQLYDHVAKRLPWVSAETRRELGKFSDVVLPTRFDSPMQFRILDGLLSRIRDATTTIGLDLSNFPHHACIPTGLVNASAVTLPNAERSFLLFDSQLFLYCHLFAKAFARCLPIVGRGERISLSVELHLVEKRLKSNRDLAARLADLLDAYVTTGSPGRAKQYDPGRDYVTMIDILRDGMELFVVGHEFGHVYAGHVATILERFGAVSEIAATGNESHRLEHEADFLGLVLTLHAMSASGYDAGLSYIGVELFFVSLELAARARHMKEHGTESGYVDLPSSSHPSATQRREFLRSALPMIVESDEEVRQMGALADAYTAVAALLWEHAKTANHGLQRTRRKRRAAERGR